MNELIVRILELYKAGNSPAKIKNILKNEGLDLTRSNVVKILRENAEAKGDIKTSKVNTVIIQKRDEEIENTPKSKKIGEQEIKTNIPEQTLNVVQDVKKEKDEFISKISVDTESLSPEVYRSIPTLQDEDSRNSKEEIIKQRIEILAQLLTSGQGAYTFCQVNKYDTKSKKELKEMLKKLMHLSLHIKRGKNEEAIKDDNFNELLNVINTEISDGNSQSRIRGYRTKVKTEIPFFVCEQGKIDTLRLRTFNNNDDLAIFILKGFKGKNNSIRYSKGYDQKVFDKINERYKSKLRTYLGQFAQMELDEAKKNVKSDNNIQK